MAICFSDSRKTGNMHRAIDLVFSYLEGDAIIIIIITLWREQ